MLFHKFIKDILLQVSLLIQSSFSKMPSFCFYIPRVSFATSETDVTHAFTTIGVVSRVDFAPLGKQPGFKENLHTNTKSAFVHLAQLFAHGKEIINTIQSGGSYKIFPNETTEYWSLLEAKTSIQDTMMNNAQIVSNCRYLEKKVEHQEAQLEEQSADIRALTEKLSSVQEVVYQLLGGLFCQKSQVQIMSDHIDFLYPYDSSTSSRSRFGEPDDSKWTTWPTTRQGDDCERRIAELKEEFDVAIVAINQHAAKGKAQDEKIRRLEQEVKELTFEPTFTPYEEDKFGNTEPMTIDELQLDEEIKPRSFVPIPMIQMVDQHNYDEIHSISSAHSSMPDLVYGYRSDSSIPDLEQITEDESEFECFKSRSELNRLSEESDSDSENGLGF